MATVRNKCFAGETICANAVSLIGSGTYKMQLQLNSTLLRGADAAAAAAAADDEDRKVSGLA